MSKENKNNNNVVVLQTVIIVLLVIIAIGAYFLGQNNSGSSNTSNNNTSSTTTTATASKDLTITIIDDKRCNDCSTTEMATQLKSVPDLAGATFEEKDFSDEGVREMLEENNINKIPAVIFSNNNVVADLANYLVATPKNLYNLNVGAKFDPFAEICDNGIDDTGNGQVDCADQTCGGSLLCRGEEKAKLDVFLMGYCPFGEIAAKALPAVLDNLKDGVNLDIHYIATKVGTEDTAESFQALHGVPEVEENIRQLCIKQEYGVNKLVDYMQTRYKNADNYGKVTDKPEVAYEANGINADTINTCLTDGSGARLLEEDVKLAQELGIGASPTWLANNKYQFGGIEASAIQTNFCKYNPEVEGCENKIEASAPAMNGQPSCN